MDHISLDLLTILHIRENYLNILRINRYKLLEIMRMIKRYLTRYTTLL